MTINLSKTKLEEAEEKNLILRSFNPAGKAFKLLSAPNLKAILILLEQLIKKSQMRNLK